MNNDNIYERFEARIAEKKAAQPARYGYDATLSLTILAENAEEAKATLEILAQNLRRFEDLFKVEGKMS